MRKLSELSLMTKCILSVATFLTSIILIWTYGANTYNHFSKTSELKELEKKVNANKKLTHTVQYDHRQDRFNDQDRIYQDRQYELESRNSGDRRNWTRESKDSWQHYQRELERNRHEQQLHQELWRRQYGR